MPVTQCIDALGCHIAHAEHIMVAVKLSGADFCVGDWLVRPSLGRIERGAETVHVTPRSMALLVYLAEAAGRVVSRNELLDILWPRMAVTQDALSQCIVELRKAFRDDSRRAAVIETIPKVGIRLMSPAAVREPQPAPEIPEGNVAANVLRSERFWLTEQPHLPPPDPLARAEFRRLTDFVGAEEHAAISRDGRWVAFISDRDGPADVFVGQIGVGDYENLTRGAIADLRNPAVRVLNFSPTGSEVVILTKANDANGTVVDYRWTVPVAGGSLRRDCGAISEIDWSPDGRRIVYHPSAPGDPLFVAAADEVGRSSQIYIAAPGVHCHFPCGRGTAKRSTSCAALFRMRWTSGEFRSMAEQRNSSRGTTRVSVFQRCSTDEHSYISQRLWMVPAPGFMHWISSAGHHAV